MSEGFVLVLRTSLVGSARRRITGVGCAVLAAVLLAGCTADPGSAVSVDGNVVSEQSVQHDTAAYIAQNATASITDAQTSTFNRAQITYLVRHALIAKAVAAAGIVITPQEVTTAAAQLSAQSASSGIASSLGLPSSDEDGVVHDLVALEALVKAIPSTGVAVQNVSVTAEGVPAATRDQAVTLRSKYLADPGAMDAAVAAAGSNGVAKHVYTLIQDSGAGSAGLFQQPSGSVSILPSTTGYLVLRTTVRSVGSAQLTAANFSAASALSDVFDLGALLVARYQGSAGISVNPRYGVWDPVSVQVVPGNDGL